MKTDREVIDTRYGLTHWTCAVCVAALTALSAAASAAPAADEQAGAVPAAMTPGLSPADSPQWRGPNRDGTYHQAEDLKPDKDSAKKIWETAVDGYFSSPVVSAGRVYCTGFLNKQTAEDWDRLFCLDAVSGAVLWSAGIAHADKQYFTARSQLHQMSFATPAVDGELVYVHGADGVLMAFSARNGQTVWTNDINQELQLAKAHGTQCSPLVVGNLVLLNAGKGGIAVDKRTGKTAWKGPDSDDKKGNGPHQSSPVLFDVNGQRGVAFLVIRYGIVGVDPATGQALWKIPLPRYELVYSDLIFHHNEVLLNEKNRKWFKVENNGQLIRKVSNIDANTDKVNLSAPLRWKDSILGFKEIVSFKELEPEPDKRCLYCMDWSSAKVKWEAPDILQGGMVLVNDQLIVITSTGHLVVAALADQGCKELLRVPVCTPKKPDIGEYRWFISIPAFANNRVYYRIPGAIGCYDLGGKK